MMLKIVSESCDPHMLGQHLHNIEKRKPQESTSVLPAKYPPKAKLENFS